MQFIIFTKKNDLFKIAQLVAKAWILQQGDRSLTSFANELSAIFNELDNYRSLISSSGDREYILMDRVYKLLQGLTPEFEGIKSSCITERILKPLMRQLLN